MHRAAAQQRTTRSQLLMAFSQYNVRFVSYNDNNNFINEACKHCMCYTGGSYGCKCVFLC